MAQKKAFLNILQTKLGLVTSQKEELYRLLQDYVDKVSALGKAVIETEEVNKFEEINTMLETCLAVLLKKSVEIEGISTGSSAMTTDASLSQSAVSIAMPGLPSPIAPQTSSASDSMAISQLYHRIGALEIAVNSCHSEVRQGTEQQKEAKDNIDSLKEKIHRLETNTAEAETRQTTRWDKVEERMKKLKESSGKQEQRHDSLDKRVKKLEVDGRRESSRMENMEGEVQTLKSQYSKIQQSSKIQTLERKVDTVTSQCSSMQAQLEKASHDLCSKMDSLSDKNDLRELSSRVDAVEKSVEISALYKEKEEKKRQELESRIAVVEGNRRNDLTQYTKKMNEVDSAYKQVCLIVDSKVTPLRRLLSILNNLHTKAVKRDETTDQGQAAVQVSQAVATKTGEELCFSSKCGSNVEVFNANKSARRLHEDYVDNAIVVTGRLLQVNEVFEVQLDKLYSWCGGSIIIGVTTQQPSELEFPGSMFHIKSNIWMMYRDTVYHNGSVIVQKYGQDLNSLKVGDRVGVVRKPDGTVHFFVNGTDQGACATNVPPNVYGIFDLFYMAVQVSIVDK